MDFLGWEAGDLKEASEARDELEISLPELHVVLSPTYAVPTGEGSENKWLMLIRVEEDDADLDSAPDDGSGWNASHHARFERLLRETDVPIGLLSTDDRIRLIHAPNRINRPDT